MFRFLQSSLKKEFTRRCSTKTEQNKWTLFDVYIAGGAASFASLFAGNVYYGTKKELFYTKITEEPLIDLFLGINSGIWFGTAKGITYSLIWPGFWPYAIYRHLTNKQDEYGKYKGFICYKNHIKFHFIPFSNLEKDILIFSGKYAQFYESCGILHKINP